MENKTKIIDPNKKTGVLEYLSIIWDYRYLSQSLAKADIKGKYAKTYSGVFLSVLQSFIGLGVYWVIFGIALNIDTSGTPYPLFVLPGLILWQYFSYLTGTASGAIIQSEHLITKLYFPRINLVFAKAISGLVEMGAGSFVFIVFMLIYKLPVNINWMFIPLILAALIIAGLSIALWISIISLYIRDLGNIIIQLTNFIIFVTPVFYPGTIVPEGFRIILFLNPLAGIIETMRWALFGHGLPDSGYLLGIIPVAVFMVSGFFIFKKIEKKITDLL